MYVLLHVLSRICLLTTHYWLHMCSTNLFLFSFYIIVVVLLNLFNVVSVPYGLKDNRGGQVVLSILEEIPSTLCSWGL